MFVWAIVATVTVLTWWALFFSRWTLTPATPAGQRQERVNEIIRSLINIGITQLLVWDALATEQLSILFTVSAFTDCIVTWRLVFVALSVCTYNLMDLYKMWTKPGRWSATDKGFALHHTSVILGTWLPIMTRRFYPMTIGGVILEWTSLGHNVREMIKLGLFPNALPSLARYDPFYRVFYTVLRAIAVIILFWHVDMSTHTAAYVFYLCACIGITLFSGVVIRLMWKPKAPKATKPLNEAKSE